MSMAPRQQLRACSQLVTGNKTMAWGIDDHGQDLIANDKATVEAGPLLQEWFAIRF